MKYYTTTTKYNCGIDLHARQMYICLMDPQGKILLHTNIQGNDFDCFLKRVEPYGQDRFLLQVLSLLSTHLSRRSLGEGGWLPARLRRVWPACRSRFSGGRSDAFRSYPAEAEHPPIEAKPEAYIQRCQNPEEISLRSGRFFPCQPRGLMVVRLWSFQELL